jgi:hypothetical protein
MLALPDITNAASVRQTGTIRRLSQRPTGNVETAPSFHTEGPASTRSVNIRNTRDFTLLLSLARRTTAYAQFPNPPPS